MRTIFIVFVTIILLLQHTSNGISIWISTHGIHGETCGLKDSPCGSVRSALSRVSGLEEDVMLVLLPGFYRGVNNTGIYFPQNVVGIRGDVHRPIAVVFDAENNEVVIADAQRDGFLVEGVTFVNGKGGDGGCVHMSKSSSFVSTNFNTCNGTKGGALFLGGNASFEHVNFVQNTAVTGGAIYAYDIGKVEIVSSTILDNTAEVSPGFHFEAVSLVEIDSIKFTANVCTKDDKTCLGVVSIVSTTGGKLTNSQFSENTLKCIHLQSVHSFDISEVEINENLSPTSIVGLYNSGTLDERIQFSEMSIVSNQGEITGGIEFSTSYAVITNTSIIDNTGSGKGPGMISKNSSVAVLKSLFQNNTTPRQGYTDFYCDVLSKQMGSCQECCTKFRCEVCLGACVRNSTSDLCYNQFIDFSDISSCVSCPYKSVPITTEWIIILSIPLLLILISFVGIALWCCKKDDTYAVIQ